MARRPRKEKQAPTNARPLNGNHLAFIDRYLATFPRNARAAYAEVYGCKLTTAAVEASKLLKDPRIVLEINRRESPAAGKYKLSADRIRREIAAIGFSDVRHYAVAADGSLTLADGAPEDALRAVQSIKVKRRTVLAGTDAAGTPLAPIVETETEVKLWDKPAALRIAAQVRGMLVKRAPVDGDGKTVVPESIEVVFVNAEDGKPKRRPK